jgi:hypothetical protein
MIFLIEAEGSTTTIGCRCENSKITRNLVVELEKIITFNTNLCFYYTLTSLLLSTTLLSTKAK